LEKNWIQPVVQVPITPQPYVVQVSPKKEKGGNKIEYNLN